MTQPRKKQRGVLHVIAALLVLSALLRATIGAEAALANSPPESTTPAADSVSKGTPTEDILAALQAREDRLTEREALFADRIQALRVAETEVAEQLAALIQAEESLRATIALADTAAESDLGRLTTVYENMTAKDAAALFEKMPPEFAAGFLGMMEPLAAAKIMAGLSPETAYSFSVVLAGRNALVPTQ